MRARITVLMAVLLVITACGVGGDAASTTTSTQAPSSSTTTTPTTTSTVPAPTTTAGLSPTTTTTQPIDVTLEGGTVTGPGRVTAILGDQVSVWVLSDVDAEIHVHGYDLFFDATAGVPIEVSLLADLPGIFEVEVEGSHTLLFDLEVTG
jgi:hypothetical protein